MIHFYLLFLLVQISTNLILHNIISVSHHPHCCNCWHTENYKIYTYKILVFNTWYKSIKLLHVHYRSASGDPWKHRMT
jgi:hypothetical protein